MCDTLIIKADAVIGYTDEFVEELVIPDGIYKIANGAFKNCYGLKHITLPESLKSIGDSAFERCSSLETIILPEDVISLGEGAFKECTTLKNADFSKSKLKTLPYECFCDCKKLASVRFPNTTLKILNRCFTGCKSLKESFVIGFSEPFVIWCCKPCVVRFIKLGKQAVCDSYKAWNISFKDSFDRFNLCYKA